MSHTNVDFRILVLSRKLRKLSTTFSIMTFPKNVSIKKLFELEANLFVILKILTSLNFGVNISQFFYLKEAFHISKRNRKGRPTTLMLRVLMFEVAKCVKWSIKVRA
jgi:hypothetical protein